MIDVRITLNGCDDTTCILMEVSEDELSFLERLAKLSKDASGYLCQPTLTVIPEAD